MTKDVVPLETPLTNAPGPRVRPSYGRRKKSDTPFPMLRTRLAGLPRISKEPTTQPEAQEHHRRPDGQKHFSRELRHEVKHIHKQFKTGKL